MENNLVGGEAIAAGGFGCVFRPALKCKGSADRTSGVSKLLIKKYADSEYNEIQKILPIIERIPNNEDYFIAKGITICEPDKLTTEDLNKFDSKCHNLTKKNYKRSNINSDKSLQELRILNTIDGGVDVQKYISGSNLDISTFNMLNENLLRLLKFGINPMNAMGMYHLDVKGANILVGRDNKCRLIDWGLTQIQIGNDVPSGIRNKPVHFNLPFGVIMFSERMHMIIDEAVEEYNTRGGAAYMYTYTFEDIIKMLFKKKILNFLEHNGHYTYIRDSIYITFVKNGGWGAGTGAVGTRAPTFEDLIITHIAKIADKYTDGGKSRLNYKKYFNDVFKHNADVWGFLTAYFDLYSNKPKEFREPGMKATSDAFYNYLNEIIYINIFSFDYTLETYDIGVIINSLKELNNITGHPIGRLTPKFPSSISIMPPTPPMVRVSTPHAVIAPLVVPVVVRDAASLCDPEKLALCISKGKVCNSATGRCVFEKMPKPKKKTHTPKHKHVPIVEAICGPTKTALCVSKGKICNPSTGRCVIKKNGKPVKVSVKAKKTSSHTGLTAKMTSLRHVSSRGESLGTRKRCPRGYRLNSITKRCKRIK